MSSAHVQYVRYCLRGQTLTPPADQCCSVRPYRNTAATNVPELRSFVTWVLMVTPFIALAHPRQGWGARHLRTPLKQLSRHR